MGYEQGNWAGEEEEEPPDIAAAVVAAVVAEGTLDWLVLVLG